MNMSGVLTYIAFLGVLTILVRPVGGYLLRVFSGQRTVLDPLLLPVERGIYRLTGVDPTVEMDWREYAWAFIRFGVLGAILLYLILRLQAFLPWYLPAWQTTPLTVDLSANTAVSFATTTTWQAYGGEITMSYFSQMAGLTAQNFLGGAGGLAVGFGFIRGFAHHGVNHLGNFWVDFVRALLWVLLPITVIVTPLLVWQGVPLNLNAYTLVQTLAGESHVLPQGPVAALEVIKNLGTNGGGFFNANGAHPFENPTALTNVVEMLIIIIIPAGMTFAFGRMVGQPRHGWLLYWVMVMLFVLGGVACTWAERTGTPWAPAVGTDLATRLDGLAAPGGNMEGKELRFGIDGSVLTAITTSNTSTGSYNSMHDSYTPVGGMVLMINLLLGEIVFGGLGSGLYSMLMVVLLALFLCGLMVGRTPEYLGKKLGPSETRMITIYTLAGTFAILIPTAIAVASPAGLAGLTTNKGAHGLSEILYAYASSMANNGQNFAGLSANSPFYNTTTALVMLVGRFGLAVVALALAGLLATQRRRSISEGTFPADAPLFAIVVIGTALVVVGLSYFPALSLGPIIEQLMMGRGT